MRFIIVWLLYGVGDLLNRIAFDPIGGILYRPYNWCMLKSSDIQGDRHGKYWPWEEAVSDSTVGSSHGE